jgi:hypothetical protein
MGQVKCRDGNGWAIWLSIVGVSLTRFFYASWGFGGLDVAFVSNIRLRECKEILLASLLFIFSGCLISIDSKFRPAKIGNSC